MRYLLLSIFLVGCSHEAKAPEIDRWKVRMVYMGELATRYESQKSCELMRKMIEANPDRPNVPDGLVRRVICAPEGL